MTTEMMKTRTVIVCVMLAAGLGRAASTNPAPKFGEVYQVLSTNLEGVSPEELNRAAVRGLLDQLGARVSLERGPGGGEAEALAGIRVFDNAFAYFRVTTVSSNLPEAFRAAYHHVSQTNAGKIKGIVLDLRFAGGTDYEGAAKMADCFLNGDRPLLNWQQGSARATKKDDAISAPVAILVNSQTSGAAEALAAVMRESAIGLILGGTTAGRASVFKEFALSDGEKLRVAVAPVSLGSGAALTQGVVPDIIVDTSLEDEKVFLQNPYASPHPSEVAKTEATNQVIASPRRFNEAELVREHAEGEDMEDILDEAGPAVAEPGPPVVADPVLARALDLLKGLAVVQPTHPG
jgi:hypothetical protein